MKDNGPDSRLPHPRSHCPRPSVVLYINPVKTTLNVSLSNVSTRCEKKNDNMLPLVDLKTITKELFAYWYLHFFLTAGRHV